MKALLDDQESRAVGAVINGYGTKTHETRSRSDMYRNRSKPDRMARIAFAHAVRTSQVIKFMRESASPFVRPATIKETFAMLRERDPMKAGERIVCLEEDTEDGDDVLVIREDGPVIISALDWWDRRFRFPVAMYY